MSTIPLSSRPTTTPFARIWRITKLLGTNPWTLFGWPLTILAAIFVMTWAIWWLILQNAQVQQGPDAVVQVYGGAGFIFVYMLVIAVQAVNFSFPLALGYGATRRSFSLGSGFTFLLLSAGYALLMTLATWLEVVTSGWGLGGSFFRTLFFVPADGWLVQWWVYFCWFVFFISTGMIFAAMYVRWKAIGLTLTFLASGLLLVGVFAFLTLGEHWIAFWDLLFRLGTIGLANVALIPSLIAALIGYLVLRRATPRG